MADGAGGSALAAIDTAGGRKRGTGGSAHDAAQGASQNTHGNLRIDGSDMSNEASYDG